MGDSGTGKSYALRTLVDAGITPFVFATEQNFIQVMKDTLGKTVHYKYVSPQPEQSWMQVLDMAKKVNQLSYENLSKVHDPFKQSRNKFLDLIVACNDFVCDCCKKSWGGINSWNTDRAFVIDSWSGASDMAFSLVIGNKPTKAMPDYMVAQNTLRSVLGPLTTQTKCTVVIIAHIGREKDEITGGTNITINSVGQKLGPDMPRMFSDVIRTMRNAATFYWDTADSQSTVVARHLPIGNSLPPSFLPLIQAWKARGGRIEVTA